MEKKKQKSRTDKKKLTKEQRGRYIRIAVAAVAALNLVLLFVFDYRVPGLSGLIARIEASRASATEYTGSVIEAEPEQLSIRFDKDTVKYNGTGELDLYDGVTVVDSSGNIYSSGELSATIDENSGKKKKTVHYTYSDMDGRTASGERTLVLTHYKGPSLEIEDDLPELTDEALGDLTGAYADYYSADDGYGTDITRNVTISAEVGEKNDGKFDLVFRAPNNYGDVAEERVSVKIDFDQAHIALSESSVTVTAGGDFDPQSYLAYAIDSDGKDVTDDVQISGGADVSTPGDYELTYQLSGDNSGIAPLTLTVHVTEE